MHVLWICGADRVGGAETSTLQLADTLRARRHVVSALCRRDGPMARALERAAIPAQSARLGGAVNLAAAARIARALGATQPDVALVTTIDEWLPTCLARPRAPTTRLVLVRHMALPLSWPLRRLADRRADAIVAVSQAVRACLLERGGISPERVHTIFNPARFRPRADIPSPAERVRARRALALADDGHWVGFFGGLDERKGVRDVAAAVRAANQALGPTHLLLCGGRARRSAPSVAEMTTELGLGGRLHYRGEIDDVETALTAADVVVVATHRCLSEALPATLIEAMACGTPVLGYATGGINEIIGTDGGAGRLARADDAADLARVLLELLADRSAAARLATAGLERVRRLFDAEQAATRYEQLFTAIGAGRAARL